MFRFFTKRLTTYRVINQELYKLSTDTISYDNTGNIRLLVKIGNRKGDFIKGAILKGSIFKSFTDKILSKIFNVISESNDIKMYNLIDTESKMLFTKFVNGNELINLINIK